MYKVDFSNPLHVHFIGIGGISMSGLAEILMNNGFKISGSDMNTSKIIDHLKERGANIKIGHCTSHINSDIDLVVYTAAIKPDNEEYQAVLSMGIPMIDRASLLGQIMGNYPYSIGISGTHGKTTTTSMISQILLDADMDPTITVGGLLDAIQGNIHVGSTDYFVTEACEYSNSFLKFYPYIAVILNIEEDHLDFFKDLSEIRASFKKYIENVSDNGYIVINSAIENYQELVKEQNCQIITYGEDQNSSDWSARNIVFNDMGYATYDLIYKCEQIDTIMISATGMHNVYNSIAAIATANALGLNLDGIKESLKKFDPPKRRFEFKGSLLGVTIIDDYAHHPTEIETTLKAAKNLKHNKLWVIFQPHTYSRTKSFLADFAKALSVSDGIIITDIYAAREKDPGDIHSKDLLEAVRKINTNCYYFSSFDEIEIFALENCIPEDVLITMGAGNIYLVGEDLLRG